MSPTTAGLLGLAGLFLLLALRMPVGIAMMLVGVLGFGVLNGWGPALALLGSEPFVISTNYELIVIPLFVLMGNFATVSGMSRDLYAAAYAWFGHWRGGLASATIAACAGFAALSGSSVAAAVTMGKVALPEMRTYRYDPRLATGAIAAGGTLGILIPPSTGFVIYAILTEESIGRLFLAGVFPGLLLTALFILSIFIQTRINPDLGPPGPASSVMDRIRAIRQASAMIGVVTLTIGGIYAGLFTPTEAAGVGAFLAMLLALVRGRLSVSSLSSLALESVRTTALVFLILVGAHIFNPFLALTHIPSDLAELLVGMELPRLAVLAILLAAYIVLGMFLEGFAHAGPHPPHRAPHHPYPGIRPHLVRRGHGHRAGNGPHQPAGGSQRLCGQGHRRGRPHEQDLRRHLSVLDRHGRLPGHPGGVSRYRAVPAEYDDSVRGQEGRRWSGRSGETSVRTTSQGLPGAAYSHSRAKRDALPVHRRVSWRLRLLLVRIRNLVSG